VQFATYRLRTTGVEPSIGPKETLVFVIDLLRVQPRQAGSANVPPQ
jgi:hypothetical protein